MEGAQIWALFERLTGQFRTAFDGHVARVIGLDMNAAFAMASAMGINPWLVAEFLPDMEAVAVSAMNRKSEDSDG